MGRKEGGETCCSTEHPSRELIGNDPALSVYGITFGRAISFQPLVHQAELCACSVDCLGRLIFPPVRPLFIHRQSKKERKKTCHPRDFQQNEKISPLWIPFVLTMARRDDLAGRKKKKTVGLQAPFIQVYLGAAQPAAAANNNKCKRVEETGFVHPTKAALRGSAQSARQLCRADDRASRRDGRFSFLFFFFYYDSFAV